VYIMVITQSFNLSTNSAIISSSHGTRRIHNTIAKVTFHFLTGVDTGGRPPDPWAGT
jgi:hypothetical protein